MKILENYVYVKRLNLNLEKLNTSCRITRDIIERELGSHEKGYTGQSTMTTGVFQAYNFLLFPLPELHPLYEEIRTMFHELNDNDEDDFYMQCWLNYYNRDDFIDWHRHWPPEHRSWHGFFCVNCEPSSTTYRLADGTIVDVKSENNNLVMSKSDGDRHRTWPWEYDEPRITIAFDIIPAKHIRLVPNHWMPI